MIKLFILHVCFFKQYKDHWNHFGQEALYSKTNSKGKSHSNICHVFPHPLSQPALAGSLGLLTYLIGTGLQNSLCPQISWIMSACLQAWIWWGTFCQALLDCKADC